MRRAPAVPKLSGGIVKPSLRVASATAAVVGLCFSVSCSYESATPTSPHAPSASAVPVLGVRPLSGDDIFANIAYDAPGFAGMYFDETGTLVLGTTGATLPVQMLGAVLAHGSATLDGVAAAITTGRVRFVSARHAFGELATWKMTLTQPRFDAITFVDIDEVTNRVVISVLGGPGAAAMEARALEAGVPADAYQVVLTQGRARPELTLSDRVRPVRGGFRVTRSDGGRCSLGVNAQKDDGLGFLVSSHCTGIFATIIGDGMEFYQNTVSSGDWLAKEAADPPLLPPAKTAPRKPGAVTATRRSSPTFTWTAVRRVLSPAPGVSTVTSSAPSLEMESEVGPLDVTYP